MAITQNTFTGNGSNLGPFSFTFKWLEPTDIKVTVGGVLKTAGTHYNLQSLNYTTKDGGQVLFTAGNAPANNATIRVYRDTDDSALSATFFSGSAIRAQDLNDDFTQNLYVTQEVNNNAVNIDGSNPMAGNLNMGGYQIDNLAQPTADNDAATKKYIDDRYGATTIPAYTRWRKTATAGQTTFSGTGQYGGTLAYSSLREQVYLNGVLQQRSADYTADNETSIVFASGLTVGDVVDIVCINNVVAGTANNAADISYSGQFSGQTVRTVAAKLADVVSVKDFGAVGDGVADDTVAIQAAATALKVITDTQPSTLYFPSGSYKITNSIDFSATGGNRMEIVGGAGSFESVTILAAYHGHGDSVASSRGVFYFSAPTGSPSGTYSRSFSVSGFQFRRLTASFRTPPAIEMIASAQSRLNNITIGSWSGTAIRMDTPQNVRCTNVTTFSGGKSFAYKDASAVTVTQSSTTLTATGNIFSADDVNKWIGIWGTGSNSYRRKAKIATYVSPTQVTLDQSETDATARRVLFGSPFASVASGSPTLTADSACFTVDDVGLYLWIRSNVATNSVFRAKINAVVSGTTVTLDTNAPFTDSTCEIAVAAVELYSSGPFGDSSDTKFINLQVENHAGLGVGVYDASVLEFYGAKIHSEQSATVDRYSVSTLWGYQLDGIFSGSLDAQYLGTYRFWLSAQTGSFHLADVISRTAIDEKLIGIAAKNTNFDGGVLLIDNLSVLGARPTQGIKDLVVDQNTQTPGYLISGAFVNNGDASNYRNAGHLTNDIYALDSGTYSSLYFESTNRTYSINPAGGAGFNRFTIRDETGAADRLYVYSTGAIGPGVGSAQDLGLSTSRWKDVYLDSISIGSGSVRILSGTGTPEGAITAVVGSLFLRTDGGVSTTLYVKQSGTGNTGWVAK